MIALWIAYALVTGGLVAVLCALAEPVARGARVATRGVWTIGIAVILLIGVLGVAPRAPHRRVALPAAAATGAPAGAPAGRAAADIGHGPEGRVAATRARIALARRNVEELLALAAGRLSAWDRPLLLLWLLSAAFLAGVAAHAALEGRRLRHGLQPREIAGTTVLLTDSVGPSAAGTGGAAILLPRWALELDEALLGLVVRHEREHVNAGDPLLLLATLLAVVLLPWHLPLWWCWRRLRLAIEVDCDARVLRACPDVRRYAQLLLLTGQRTTATPWASRPLVTVVAPLQPHASQLARRIIAMTEPRTSRLPLRIALVGLLMSAIAAAVFILPLPRRALAQRPARSARAVVHLTSLGLRLADSSGAVRVLIYTSGGGRAGVDLDKPKALTDTLRLDRLPAMTLDVTDGDVHVQLATPGSMRVEGDVTGGPATHVSAEGRHFTFLRHGRGVQINE